MEAVTNSNPIIKAQRVLGIMEEDKMMMMMMIIITIIYIIIILIVIIIILLIIIIIVIIILIRIYFIEAFSSIFHALFFFSFQGELIGICGMKGSGKSSLLAAILGRVSPIFFFGSVRLIAP